MAAGDLAASRSSLPYQILMYCNSWWFCLFFLAELLCYVFKGQTLPFPESGLLAEVILLFILGGLEYIRLFFGMKGNLTERVVSVTVSLFLSLAAGVGFLYLLLWQTYVLKIEVILVVVQLVFVVLEVLFAIVAMITFARSE